MTDYTFEACTKDHHRLCQPSNPYQCSDELHRLYHKWICLAFDRDKEFELRVKDD